MGSSELGSYRDIFYDKYKKCKSKKDYKRLCKSMLYQFDTIDKIDENQWKLFSDLIGQEAYAEVIAASIKMYMLDLEGIPYDILSVERRRDDC